MPPHVTIRLTINEAKALDALLEQVVLDITEDPGLLPTYVDPEQTKAAMRAVDKINEALVAKTRSMT